MQRAKWFRSPNLLFCFGTDFQWFNAEEMYSSMDLIIDHISAHNGAGDRYDGVSIQYSMLDDYFSAVHEWSNGKANVAAKNDSLLSSVETEGVKSWSVRDDGDFLPYNTLNCGGASQDFDAPCSQNAGERCKPMHSFIATRIHCFLAIVWS